MSAAVDLENLVRDAIKVGLDGAGDQREIDTLPAPESGTMPTPATLARDNALYLLRDAHRTMHAVELGIEYLAPLLQGREDAIAMALLQYAEMLRSCREGT